MSTEPLPNVGVRINLVVEGLTEERFVKDVLAPHFGGRGAAVAARRVTTSRWRGRTFRGGMPSYGKVRYDLAGWLKQDAGAYVTTMFDLYGLHTSFPGYEASRGMTSGHRRAEHLEQALVGDLGSDRFIPYLQVHEFEALLFSAPNVLDAEMVKTERPSRRRELDRIVEKYGTPEEIDDAETPSKRLDALYPGYAGIKALVGTRIAARIGLEILRARCPHFDAWLRRLEVLAPLR